MSKERLGVSGNDTLNPKQERFCQEYLVDLNGTQEVYPGLRDVAGEFQMAAMSAPSFHQCPLITAEYLVATLVATPFVPSVFWRDLASGSLRK